jgi:hypothetical protein
MEGARKGPHRSLGFAFGYWFQTTALPTPAILLFAEIEHRPLGRRSQSEPLVFSQPHSMRQTRSNSAISRSRMATCLRNSRAMPRRSPGALSCSSTRASSSRFLTRRRGRFREVHN